MNILRQWYWESIQNDNPTKCVYFASRSLDSLLHVGIERARNLAALFIPEGRSV